jgi:hypothetical protein
MKNLLLGVFFVVSFIPGVAYSATFDDPNICRAVISVVMGQPTKIIKADRVVNGVVYLSYNRPSDGKYWAQKCKIIGSKAIWGSAEGRWQNGPHDSVIEIIVSKDKKLLSVQETFSDGSSLGVKVFKSTQL